MSDSVTTFSPIRAALVLSGGVFEQDAVAAITETLLRLPHATGEPGDEKYEANVRGIAQVAFMALFEHCVRHRGTIDLPLTGTPYAALLLLASSLVTENDQMREATRRNAEIGLKHEQELLRQISELRHVAEGFNSLHGCKSTASPREVAHMAWVDHQHRHDIGGLHTSGFCKACGDSGTQAQLLFASVPDALPEPADEG